MTAFALPCANKRLQATRSKQRAPESLRYVLRNCNVTV